MDQALRKTDPPFAVNATAHGALQVVLLFVCDTLNSAFDIAFVYIPLVRKYGAFLPAYAHPNTRRLSNT